MSTTPALTTQQITYDDKTVKQFVFASVAWGAIGLIVGLLIALQLAFHGLNFDTPWLTFGRLRPLHTNAAIFALVGNMMFAGIYHSTQRLCKARLGSDLLSAIHFWGWQLIIVLAAVTLPLGITQGKEYAELEWGIDLLVTVVWVVFALNFFIMLAKRNERHLYVAIWFYIATIITIAILYIVNNLALPYSATKSYSLFGGAQDALTQWWYGHNAVAFFLTTPILGIMYYYLPKAAGRPVYSYRLSIIHFWALVFIYIWAGPHHLLYTSLPDWAQSLGMIFSLMLWAPSWGGMLNGLLTLRGAWDKVRTDPVLKFFVAGVTFYGMSTFEGPLLSVKAVNALSHYTDWTIGHVHGGTLGWNGFMAAGMFYWLVPKLFNTRLASTKMADAHFWLGTLGILIYMVSMWIAGIAEGLMWNAVEPTGGLTYPDWAEMIGATWIMYLIRAIGGTLYVVGWILMAVNLWKTYRQGEARDVTVEVTRFAPVSGPSNAHLIFGLPFLLMTLGLFAAILTGQDNIILGVLGAAILLALVFWVDALTSGLRKGKEGWHDALEGKPLAFTVLVFLAVAVGGVIELVPGLMVNKEAPLVTGAAIYTPLEVEGRDIYVREGCYNCHSQQIRPFYSEKLRYGDPSTLAESQYDHPFQWGSKRTGPDLAREGGKRGHEWHWTHMLNPRDIDESSVMPNYPWLATSQVDSSRTGDKMRTLRTLGLPYTDQEIATAQAAYETQANGIVISLKESVDVTADPKCELIALIAYLQRLGKPATVPAKAGD